MKSINRLLFFFPNPVISFTSNYRTGMYGWTWDAHSCTALGKESQFILIYKLEVFYVEAFYDNEKPSLEMNAITFLETLAKYHEIMFEGI